LPYKILLVEDDEIILGVYSSFLSNEGMNVTTAVNGEIALDKLKQEKFDLLITDVKMPGLSGIQLIRQVKDLQPHLPSIIISGHATVSEAAEAVNLKVFHFLKKPIRDLTELKNIALEAINFYSGKRQAGGETPASAAPSTEEIPEAFKRTLIDTYLKPRFGIFTTGLAHNINGPLGGVMGYAQLAAMKNPNIPNLDIIADQASKAASMLSQIADKGHSENNRKITALDLKAFLEKEAQVLNFNLFYKHNVEKKYELTSVPLFKIIPAHFSQIFNQLLQNALDAVFEAVEKRILISLGSKEDYIYLIIKDTGCGISSGDLGKIFQPGFSTKPRPDQVEDAEMPCGYGMGLYIVREILKLYNGEINLQSQGGKGTTAIVKLPLRNS